MSNSDIDSQPLAIWYPLFYQSMCISSSFSDSSRALAVQVNVPATPSVLYRVWQSRISQFVMKREPGQSLYLNCKNFCKIWSILLTSVDNGIENNDCYGQSHAGVLSCFRVLVRLWRKRGARQGWDNVKSAKGGQSFSSTAGFNDGRGYGLNGLGW